MANDKGAPDAAASRRPHRRQEAPVHRRGVSGIAARRPRDLHLRRAGQGRYRASGVPQLGALGGAALRRAARQGHQGCAHRADRHRLRRLHHEILQGGALARRRDRAARRHRRLGPHHLWLARPEPGLQGRLPQYARRQCRVLRQIRRQCPRLVQARPGSGAVPQPRSGQSADRPQQTGRRGQGRLHHHPERDRRRHLCLRRQGRRHQFGADQLQFPRPEHGPGDHRSGHGGDVHRADEYAGHQTDLPAVL